MQNQVTSWKDKVIQALQTVQDPELPLNIYEMGIIYDIDVQQAPQRINILMTLTTPSCPVAEELPLEVEQAVKKIKGIQEVRIKLTFDPPYSMDRLSESAKLTLGIL